MELMESVAQYIAYRKGHSQTIDSSGQFGVMMYC